jgi:hypothetical protein
VTVDWAELQVKTTANFCSRSPFWNFISGGLSNQIEHHLFPSTCHVHYPAISPIVKKTCEEFGIKYHPFPCIYYWRRAAFKRALVMQVLRFPHVLVSVGCALQVRPPVTACCTDLDRCCHVFERLIQTNSYLKDVGIQHPLVPSLGD